MNINLQTTLLQASITVYFTGDVGGTVGENVGVNRVNNLNYTADDLLPEMTP